MSTNRPIRILIVGDPDYTQSLIKKRFLTNEFKIDFVPEQKFAAYILESPYHIVIATDDVAKSVLEYMYTKKLFDCAAVYILLTGVVDEAIVRRLRRDKRFPVQDLISVNTMVGTGIEIWLPNPIKSEHPYINVNLGLKIELVSDNNRKEAFEDAAKQLLLKMGFSKKFAQFEELICRVFHDYESVTLKPLTGGYSGAGILKVQAWRKIEGGTIKTAPQILKFGKVDDLDMEHKNYDSFVRYVLHRGQAAYGQAYGRTASFGAILYTFVGEQANESGEEFFEDFAAVFHNYENDYIEQVLKNLFKETCLGWYDQAKIFDINLTEEYRKKLKLENIDRLPSVEGISRQDQQLAFDELDLNLPNPLYVFENQIFQRKTYRSATHGDLHPHNILVNKDGTSWLIDFSHTGIGHILRDLASLDVAIRIAILADDYASLNERYQLEEALLYAQEFSDIEQLSAPEDFSPILKKAFNAIRVLRLQAYEFVRKNANSHLHEYYISLFYYSIRALKYPNLSELQHRHALLSAAMIIDQMSN